MNALRGQKDSAVTVTVEWEHAANPPETVELVTTSATRLVLYGQLFQKTWNDVLDALGWSRKGNGVHRLRHSFAVNMIEDGASPGEVKVALNHSDVMVTMKEYGDRWDRADDRIWDRQDKLYAHLGQAVAA